MIIALVLGYLLLRALGAFLITGDQLKKADVVVALGGGSGQRVTEAVRLVKAGYASLLLITEPGELVTGEGLASQHYRTEAIDSGLSPYAIQITEGVQHTTHDEAEAVLAYLRNHDMQTAIVVTDPFHTQRTRFIFRDVFRGSGKTVRVQSAPGHWYRSDTWFLHPEGWQLTLQEYAKLVGFWLGFNSRLD